MSASVFPPARGPLDALASGGVAGARHAIDHLDDAVVVMAGLRRRLVGVVAHGKRVAGLPLRDGQREAQVLSRARQVAARVAVPNDTADALMRVLISDACRQQAQSVPSSGVPAMPSHLIQAGRTRMLGLLPPPRRWQPLLRRLPRALHAPLVVRVLARALRCLDPASLDLVRGRRLGIAIDDLGLEWVLSWDGGRLVACTAPAEATVRGSATDLLLLASRLEDADTLFFQRRLVLTGDTELGLTVRNLLDRLPWEELPLGLRIPLQRSSLLLRAARDAHRRR
jgi:Putative lipid carrier protein